MKSTETTIAGAAVIIAGVAVYAVALLTSGTVDGVTVTAGTGLIAAGVGLLRARDNNKSSEDVGAK